MSRNMEVSLADLQLAMLQGQLIFLETPDEIERRGLLTQLERSMASGCCIVYVRTRKISAQVLLDAAFAGLPGGVSAGVSRKPEWRERLFIKRVREFGGPFVWLLEIEEGLSVQQGLLLKRVVEMGESFQVVLSCIVTGPEILGKALKADGLLCYGIPAWEWCLPVQALTKH